MLTAPDQLRAARALLRLEQANLACATIQIIPRKAHTHLTSAL